MPDEQEMPAPVTTTIFFRFATASERSLKIRLVCGSLAASARLSVTVIVDGLKANNDEGGPTNSCKRAKESARFDAKNLQVQHQSCDPAHGNHLPTGRHPVIAGKRNNRGLLFLLVLSSFCALYT